VHARHGLQGLQECKGIEPGINTQAWTPEEATFTFVYLGFLIVVAGEDTNTYAGIQNNFLMLRIGFCAIYSSRVLKNNLKSEVLLLFR